MCDLANESQSAQKDIFKVQDHMKSQLVYTELSNV